MNRLSLMLLVAMACGGSEASTDPPQSPRDSSGGDVVPSTTVSTEPATEEARLAGFWASASTDLPFRSFRIQSHDVDGQTVWCGLLEGAALGAHVLAVDEAAATVRLWLRPGEGVGTPPSVPEGAPCPEVFPAVSLSSGALPSSAPAVVDCRLEEDTLLCPVRGRDVAFVDVARRMTLESRMKIARDHRDPNSSIDGFVSCDGCNSRWLGARPPTAEVELDGHTYYGVNIGIGELLVLMASYPEALFRYDDACDDCED